MPETVRVYVDTNVFIAAYESIGAKSDHGWWIFDAAEKREFQLVTSELTLAELLVRPLSEGNSSLCETYQSVICEADIIHVASVTREALIASANLRVGRSGLRLPDAVHCATALMTGCKAIVSDDARLPKGLGVEVVNFGPMALERLRTLAK